MVVEHVVHPVRRSRARFLNGVCLFLLVGCGSQRLDGEPRDAGVGGGDDAAVVVDAEDERPALDRLQALMAAAAGTVDAGTGRGLSDGGLPSAAANPEVIGSARKNGRIKLTLRSRPLVWPQRSADVDFPDQASGSFSVTDSESRLSMDVSLQETNSASAELVDGLLVYRKAHKHSADIVQRLTTEGTEDYVQFAAAPAQEQLRYTVALSTQVKGLRLVGNALELLDSGGVPRLRVRPPHVLGSDGPHDALLTVEGCSFDANPAPPWGRAVVAPGASRCTVVVSWSQVRYPAVVDPGWVATGGMVSSRYNHTATLLPNGKVLLNGGQNTIGAVLSSAELYDPTTRTFAATGSMITARTEHFASALTVGSGAKVIAAGGYPVTTKSELYDVAAGSWSAAGVMKTGRRSATSTTLPNGSVFVIGGTNTSGVAVNTTEIYSPGSNSWAYGASLVDARSEHTASLVTAGGLNRLFVIGGYKAGTLASVEAYTISTGTWTKLANLAVPRQDHVAAVLSNGKIVIAGGSNDFNPVATAQLFDPVAQSWTSLGNLGVARAYSAGVLLGDGHVLVTGGKLTDGSSSAAVDNLDPSTGSWVTGPALSIARTNHTATTLQDGSVLVTGGKVGTTAFASGELYIPGGTKANGQTCSSNGECSSAICSGGRCAATCDDGNPCTIDSLGPSSCTHAAAAAGSGCDDGNACTYSDSCNGSGVCVGSAITCTSDACTTRACNGTSTCAVTYQTSGTGCSDGNACTYNDVCNGAGACAGTTISCTSDACTARACNGTASCTTTPRTAGTACDDGQSCTYNDVCNGAGSCAGTAITCTSDACTTRACNGTASCASTPRAAGTVCDDGQTCTYSDVCNGAGVCAGTAVTCTSDACTARTCNGTASCTSTPRAVGIVCDDGQACTYNDVCNGAGSCNGTAISCTSDACTIRTCNGTASCTSTPRAAGTGCDDGQACTYNDVCNGTGTCAGTVVVCASTACVTRTCNGTSSCSAVPVVDGTPCSNGNLCVSGEACQAGSCGGGATKSCPPAAACQVAAGCDPLTGSCSTSSAPNGTACDDNNSCTTNDSCTGGSCAGAPVAAGTPCQSATPCASNQRSCDGAGSCACAPLPPDPATVAPPLNPTIATTIGDATAFIYSGPSAVQMGVASGTIDPVRVAALRGRAVSPLGVPVPGAIVTAVYHPEFGTTTTRADGGFEFVVNGGGMLTLQLSASGYLTVHRTVATPVQDYVVMPDVVLTALDSAVTAVDVSAATNSLQTARGNSTSDINGSRTATLLFAPGTTAAMEVNGSTQPLTQAHVRATEFTVGDTGPLAMPGALPTSSGYTYAVEYSVDEAISAGASKVVFNQPVVAYVDNFLEFQVGQRVPVGYYDRQKATWVGSNDGRIIKILGASGGAADLDLDGSGVAASTTALAALGISDAERQRLLALYSVGQSLWRVMIDHFTPWDFNWPYAPPPDAIAPSSPPIVSDDSPDAPGECGSYIDCHNLILGEDVPLHGTRFSLSYRSNRTSGYKTAYRFPIQISGGSLPASLKRIDLTISVAGKTFSQSFGAIPNLATTFSWDGIDGYGRMVQSAQPTTVQIGYVYPALYQETRAQFSRAWADFPSGIVISGKYTRETILSQTLKTSLGASLADSDSLGGWTLDVHHSYDPVTRTLYLGDGTQRVAQTMGAVIQTSYGPSVLSPQTLAIAVAPNGSLYAATGEQVVRYDRDGRSTVVAGLGTGGNPSGDGGPATSAILSGIVDVALSPNGSMLYILDSGTVRVVDLTTGIISGVTAPWQYYYPGCSPDGPALQVTLCDPRGIAAGPDGSVYIAEHAGFVRRILDGRVTTIAGRIGSTGVTGDGGPAINALCDGPSKIAVAPDGVVYYYGYRDGIRRIGTDGVIRHWAGGPSPVTEGVPAVNQSLDSYDTVLRTASDGNLYYTSMIQGFGRVRRILPNGIINTVAGTGSSSGLGDGFPALAAAISPLDVAVAPDNTIYILNYYSGYGNAMRVVKSSFPGLSTDMFIASTDGKEFYEFDTAGRHIRTFDSLTKAVRYQFTYDASGRLQSIRDVNQQVTTIERDASGKPLSIIGPFGHRTMLSTDPNGYLSAVVDPAGRRHAFVTDATGLLTKYTTPGGGEHVMTYDSQGRLIKDADPSGGFKGLTRADAADGFATTVTTAMGRTRSYRVQKSVAGDEQRSTTDPDGTIESETIAKDKSTTLTTATGMFTSATNGPDPRFGMQAPISVSSVVRTPGGLQSTFAESRSAVLTNPSDLGSLRSQTDVVSQNGQVFTSTFDATTLTTTRTTPTGRQETATQDSKGHLIRMSVPNLADVSFGYDAHGQLISVAEGTRTPTSVSYDAQGNVSSVTNSAGKSFTFGYDASGQMTAETLPDGRVVQYAYDADGKVVNVTPPSGPPHQFIYTASAQLQSYQPPVLPGAGSTSYEYDLDHHLKTVYRPDGSTVNVTYDTAGRPSGVAQSGGTVSYTYDTAGRVATMVGPAGESLTYGYDGELVTSVAFTGPVAGTVQRSFDSFFRLASEAVTGGQSIAYQYDGDGLLTGAGALTVSRDARNGLVTGTVVGNFADVVSSNEYGEATGYTASYNGGAQPLYGVQYVRDGLGRIVQKSESYGGTTDSYRYVYDAPGRLTDVEKNGVAVSHYEYDAHGNRASAQTGGVLASGSYDAQDRLVSYGGASYAYTANGEVASRTSGGGTTSYHCDGMGRLVGVDLPDGTVVSYLLDGRGRRVGRRVNGTLVQGLLYRSELAPIAELDGAGHLVSQFVYGRRVNVPDYILKNGSTYRVITDQLGSPRLVVDVATGAVVQKVDYDEFGGVVEDTNPGFQPFGFAGGLYDRDTKLVHFGAREYDAVTGRWLSSDPLRFDGGLSNFYSYVGQDPVNYIDITGLEPGKVYSTIEDAARAALDEYILLTIKDSKERAGRIIEKDDGYTYTRARTGRNNRSFPGPMTKACVGSYHTHPSNLSDEFSERDRAAADREKIPEFMEHAGTREIKVYTPGAIDPIQVIRPGR